MYQENIWGISANVNNYFGLFITHYFTNSRYKPGDTIDVECISKRGYPPPNITWFINGEKVNTLHEIRRDIHKVEI